MKAKRAEFSDTTKGRAWERCGGLCEGCGNQIRPGNGPHYHHVIDAAIGGSNALDNCQVLCIRPCHKAVTDAHRPELTRAKRIFEKRIGLRKSSRPFPKRGKDQQWGRGWR